MRYVFKFWKAFRYISSVLSSIQRTDVILHNYSINRLICARTVPCPQQLIYQNNKTMSFLHKLFYEYKWCLGENRVQLKNIARVQTQQHRLALQMGDWKCVITISSLITSARAPPLFLSPLPSLSLYLSLSILPSPSMLWKDKKLICSSEAAALHIQPNSHVSLRQRVFLQARTHMVMRLSTCVIVASSKLISEEEVWLLPPSLGTQYWIFNSISPRAFHRTSVLTVKHPPVVRFWYLTWLWFSAVCLKWVSAVTWMRLKMGGEFFFFFFYLKMKNEPHGNRVVDVLLHAVKFEFIKKIPIGPKASASYRLVTKLILKACVWLILLQEVTAWASIWLRLIDKLIFQLNRLAETYLSVYY